MHLHPLSRHIFISVLCRRFLSGSVDCFIIDSHSCWNVFYSPDTRGKSSLLSFMLICSAFNSVLHHFTHMLSVINLFNSSGNWLGGRGWIRFEPLKAWLCCFRLLFLHLYVLCPCVNPRGHTPSIQIKHLFSFQRADVSKWYYIKYLWISPWLGSLCCSLQRWKWVWYLDWKKVQKSPFSKYQLVRLKEVLLPACFWYVSALLD